MELDHHPLVSVGVPVFNGESGLSRCLEGLLRQDYPNLEIIISDNASTDSTPLICDEFVRMDPRVKYWRADQNRGSGWNFNRVFELSSGEYFLWAAHDDDHEPSFISACVEQLQRHPDAVLCQTHTAVSVEGHDRTLYLARLDTFEDIDGIVERYRETLKRFPATAFYGVYRSSAMRKTKLWEKILASDLAFIQELSIHGGFIQVPTTMFRYTARESWNTVQQDAGHFLGKPKAWWYVPFVVLFMNHSRRLAHSPIPLGLKLRLWTVLTLHQIRHVALKMLLKVAGVVCPEGRKESLGRALYWRYMHNPNIKVVSADLFFQRVCKPQLGWWR
jgi:glycosyltransferase involved in cell wall biosynthesis